MFFLQGSYSQLAAVHWYIVFVDHGLELWWIYQNAERLSIQMRSQPLVTCSQFIPFYWNLYDLKTIITWHLKAPAQKLSYQLYVLITTYSTIWPTLMDVISSMRQCSSVEGSSASSIVCLVLDIHENWSSISSDRAPSTTSLSSRTFCLFEINWGIKNL